MKQSALCGCFCCIRIFPPNLIGTDVGEWRNADGKPISLFEDVWKNGERWDGWIRRGKRDHPDSEQTATCPYCAVDSLIPEKSGFPLTYEFLKAMHLHWFRLPEKFKTLDEQDKEIDDMLRRRADV